ncbi:MAG: tape measure protein [Muribaculaceae bacterium]|nr:tape measure protein [Muribaculaceae bacterium]
MPTLSFDIHDNLDSLNRITARIADLQRQLATFDTRRPTSELNALELELASARKQQEALIESSARAAHELETSFSRGANTAARSVTGLFSALQNPVGTFASIAGVGALGVFLDNIKTVRGQFQLMETNIATILGSAKKGQDMMAQLNEYAKVSPLDFKGSVGAAQQMLGFGIDEKKVIPFMKALGDVSMGNAASFNSLTLAFSQMSAAGKLMGQDLMQMVNAGFQPLEQLSKDTGKSIGQLKDEMSQGKISAEMVQEAFLHATEAGGKYYNMAANATATIDGQMSMLEDATTLMFNDLGEKSQGFIITLIQGATALVENYDKVAVALAGIGLGFAAFRTEKLAEQKQALDAMTDATNRLAEARRQAGDASFDDEVQDALDKEIITLEEAIEWQQTLNDLKKEGADGKTLQQLRKEADARVEATEAVRAESEALREFIETQNSDSSEDDTPDYSGFDTDLQEKLGQGLISEEDAERLQQMRDTMQEMTDEAQERVLATQADLTYSNELVEQYAEEVRNAQERNDKAQEHLSLMEERNRLLDEASNAGLSQEDSDRLDAIQDEIGALSDSEIAEEARAAAINLATQESELNSAEQLRNAMTTEARNAIEQQTTTATAANTAAQAGNTTAIDRNTAAQGRATVATRLHSLTQKAATVSSTMFRTAILQVKQSWEAFKVSLMSNPLGFIIGAVGMLVSGIMALTDMFGDSDEAAKEAGKSHLEEKANIDSLYASMKAFSEDTKVHKDAREQLIKVMKEHGIEVDKEKVTLQELIGLHDNLIAVLKEEREQKILNDSLESYKEEVKEAEDTLTNAIGKQITGDNAKYKEQYLGVIKMAMEDNRELIREMNEAWESRDFERFASLKSQWYGKANEQLAILNEKLGDGADFLLKDDFGRFDNKITQGVMAFVEATDEAQHKQEALSESIRRGQASKVELYSAEGKDVKTLLKDFSDATDAVESADNAIKEADKTITDTQKSIDKLGETEVKPSVDKESVSEAKQETQETNEEIDRTGEKDVTPTVDSSQMQNLKDTSDSAKQSMDNVDSTTVNAKVEYSFWERFMQTLTDCWDVIRKIFKLGGQELPEISSPADPHQKEREEARKQNEDAKRKKQESQSSKSKAGSKQKESLNEIKRQIKDAKNSADIASIVKALKEELGRTDIDDANLATYKKLKEEAEKKQEKIDKKVGLKKDKGKDDPKQRAYNVRKQQEQEQLRIEAEALKERQRLRDLETQMMEESYDKQIRLAENKQTTQLENLEASLQKEIRAAKDRDLKLWKAGGKDRKDYQWTQSRSDAEYEAEVKQVMGYATQRRKIEYDTSEAIRKINEKSEEAAREYLKEFGTRIEKRKALLDEYAAKIKEAETEGEKARLKAELKRDTTDADSQAYDMLIAQYGTFQERKLVLAREYARKINDAATEAEAAMMRLEWKQKEQELNMAEQDSINGFEPLFAVLSDLSDKSLANLEQRLVSLMHESDLSADQLKEVGDRLAEVRSAADSRQSWFESINPFSKSTLNPNASQIKEYERRRDAARERQSVLEQKSRVHTANMELSRNRLSELTGIDRDEISTDRLAEIESMFGDNSEVRKALESFSSEMGAASEASAGAAEAAGEAAAAEAGAAGASAAAGPAITDAIIHKVNEHLQSANELIETVGLSDTEFGRAFSDFAESSQYATQAFDSLKNGDFFGVVKNLYGAFGSLGNFLGRLGIGGMGESDINLHDDMERLSRSNEALQKAISALADDLKDATTAEALDIYLEQKTDLEQAEKDMQGIMMRAGASKNNGFLGIGAKSSSNKKVNKALSASDWAQVSKAAGTTVRSASDLWTLTSEQMANVMKHAPAIWSEIKKYAAEGNDDVAQYLDEYVEYYRQYEELTELWSEKATGTTFDSVASEFRSMLADMDSSVEDFTDNFENMMRNAVINSLMNDYVNQRLTDWYQKFSEFTKDGKLNTKEVEELRSDYKDITDSSIAKRDNIMEVLDLDEASAQQQSSRRTLQGMTQDTADNIDGRMTAILIAVEAIRQAEGERGVNIALMTERQWELISVEKASSQTLLGIEEQLAKSYLELQTISENTGAIVAPIRMMQSDINDILKNIKNL